MNELYHNPICSKSRNAFRFLTQQDIDFKIILYLETGLTKAEIDNLLTYLRVTTPLDLVRTKENIWKTEYAHSKLTNDDIIQALIKYPHLLERPIYITNEQGMIVKSLEKLQELITTT